MLVWLRSASMSPVTAVMASGVFCRFSLRNCAVTVISSSCSVFAACCASTAPLDMSNASVTPREIRVFLYMFPPKEKKRIRSMRESDLQDGIARCRVEADQVETLLHAMRMFAHQRIGAARLTRLECVDDRMVLPGGVVQPVVHLVQSRAIERQRLRPGERHPRDTLQRGGNRGAFRGPQDE